MRYRVPILLIAGVLLAACSPQSLMAPPTPKLVYVPPLASPTAIVLAQTSPEPASVAASGASGLPAVSGQIEKDLQQVETDAAKLRGLKPKTDVPEYFITKDQLRTNMLALRDKTYTREDARRGELELWLMRFVNEPSIGLYQLEAELMSEEVLGYYDQDKKELYVLSGQGDYKLDPLARMTLAHEFTHAMQDQYYDLQKLLPMQGSDNGDRMMAARSVVEGDATLSGLLYADQYMSATDFQKMMLDMGGGSSSALDNAPDIFRDGMYFPYTTGLQFVKALYTRGGFKAINSALADPPHSTEQIMHPEKYLQTPRDEPRAVGLPPLTSTLGVGWNYVESDSLGEFDLGELLNTNGVSKWQSAAAGWGGGQYDFYENGTNSLVLMGARWDTKTDATQFATAMQQALSSARKDGSLWTDGKRFFGLKSGGDRVIFIGSTDRAATQRVLAAVKP